MVRPELRAHLCTLALALTYGACSAYDPSLLTSQKRAGASKLGDAGPSAAAGDAGLPNEGCDASAEDPVCVRAHAQTLCLNGKCLIASCKSPYVDCDGQQQNGCEATLMSSEHCGLCGAACRFTHAAGSCNNGQCKLADCDHGFADCDDDKNNGCETALDSTSDCGACHRSCSVGPHAVVGCSDGECAVANCVGTFGDCNHQPNDGCEEPLTSAEHCGSCDATCHPTHAKVASCASGKCVISTCEDGYTDCNGQAADGCEATLKTADNCGGCGNNCSFPHVEVTSCNMLNGPAACGIDHGCTRAIEGCVPGALTNGCARGYSDCDEDPSNGCEVDLTQLPSCGECNRTCVLAHAQRECRSGTCATVGCSPGYAQCGSNKSCTSLLDDPQNCGDCGHACSADAPNCAGGKCTPNQCQTGSADCDGDAANACEANLNDATNCGGCGLSCQRLPHATGACRNGSCEPQTCDTGFGDCDKDPNNGCEADLRTLDHCGSCEKICSFPNAQAECSDGQCRMRACSDKRSDCNANPNDGCEVDLTLPGTCGSCTNKCQQLPGVESSSCMGSSCDFACQAGRANCDGRTDNGCEASLSDGRTCGACSNDCGQLPNVVSADCSSGVCEKLRCEAGFADCNGNPADGCERSVRTNTDCGACNQACAPAHGTGTCSTGQCVPLMCDRGFDNCDNDPKNGCEAALSSPDHCGSCMNVCSAAAHTCVNGSCGCASDAECPATDACCNGRCLNKMGGCVPWPCIPAIEVAQTDLLNCGGCDLPCIGWCCASVF